MSEQGAAQLTNNAATTNQTPVAEGQANQTPAPEANGQQQPKAEEGKTVEAKPSAPEKYELNLPEKSAIEPEMLGKVEAYAKANNLSNEQAQAVLNHNHEIVNSYVESANKKLAGLNEVTWKDELIKDEEFGGSKFQENGELAAKAAEKFFGKEFVDELKTMNLNHHPKLFRGFVRIAKAMQNDKFVNPGMSSGSTPIEDIFYKKE